VAFFTVVPLDSKILVIAFPLILVVTFVAEFAVLALLAIYDVLLPELVCFKLSVA
jgi:hypothetical protein